MAVRIRLARVGRKNRPFFRMVVADSKFARDGRFIEILGRYDPFVGEESMEVNEERCLYWLKVGALPTNGARAILRSKGVLAKWRGGETVAAGAEG